MRRRPEEEGRKTLPQSRERALCHLPGAVAGSGRAIWPTRRCGSERCDAMRFPLTRDRSEHGRGGDQSHDSATELPSSNRGCSAPRVPTAGCPSAAAFCRDRPRCGVGCAPICTRPRPSSMPYSSSAHGAHDNSPGRPDPFRPMLRSGATTWDASCRRLCEPLMNQCARWSCVTTRRIVNAGRGRMRGCHVVTAAHGPGMSSQCCSTCCMDAAENRPRRPFVHARRTRAELNRPHGGDTTGSRRRLLNPALPERDGLLQSVAASARMGDTTVRSLAASPLHRGSRASAQNPMLVPSLLSVTSTWPAR